MAESEDNSPFDDLVIPLDPSSVGSRWAIGTYLRIRPPGPEDIDVIQYKIQNAKATDNTNRSIIEMDIPLDADPGLVHNNSATGTLKYEFDNVFNISATQEDVFQTVARDKVLDALEGVNCTVFAYGQTGSGKTYSIFGGESFQDRGLIPRTLSMLFKELKERKTKNPQFQFKVRISFTEIYKETVYDLLHQQREGQVALETYPTVQVMEGEDGITLRNLSVYEVITKEDALKLFFLGNKNRITTATTMNNVSSRSHAIFTIAVDTEGRKGDRTIFTSGKINLVDLAGSERMYKMANTKEAITEAKAINLSLHYLEQVIVCLREQANQLNRAAIAAAAATSPAPTGNASNGLTAVGSTASLLSATQVSEDVAHHSSLKDVPRDLSSTRQSGVSIISASSADAIPTANTSKSNSNNHTTASGKSTATRHQSMNNIYNRKDSLNNIHKAELKETKDSAPKEDSSSKSYFIPYRNSVLTSMLRDSLGGNCRSSFLLTISPCKFHFEETVATCRFGQRCGEVKVKVQANTEISLFDQLKDLQHKIKVQERRYLSLDEQRKQIERLLSAEQELRAIQTSIRALTPQEKLHCKSCVQELLAQAKDSLAIATQHVETNPDIYLLNSPLTPEEQHHQHDMVYEHIEDAFDSSEPFDSHRQHFEVEEGKILPPLYADPAHNPPDPHTEHLRKQSLIKDMANDLVEKTQDELYTQLESMDKAVLVELATALGGLVQSLFIDREMIKQDMLLQEMARQKAIQDQYIREQLEFQRRNMFRRAPIEELLLNLDSLPDTVIQSLVYGALFLKHSSSKGFLSAVQTKTVPRYVSISSDLKYLLWRTIELHHSTGGGNIGSGGTTTGGHNNANSNPQNNPSQSNKLSSIVSTTSSVNNQTSNSAAERKSLRKALGGFLDRHNPATNPNHIDETATAASGAEDIVSIPLTAYESVEYFPVTKTIELRAKPGQSKHLVLEFLGQNHTVGYMTELFHQPQYQILTSTAASASSNSVAFTFLDFVLSAEEWVKALRYLLIRANNVAGSGQQNQQLVHYGA